LARQFRFGAVFGNDWVRPGAALHLRVSAVRKIFQAVAKPGNTIRKSNAASYQVAARSVAPIPNAQRLPTLVHWVNCPLLSDLAPGDMLFLDDFAHLREFFVPNFIALIACPVCGTPGLITTSQYYGSVPVVCESNSCSGLFRIVEESQIVYLPPT